jgi:N12 class adenine-specific DNA methylase
LEQERPCHGISGDGDEEDRHDQETITDRLKANVQQMANEFLRFYPNANILAPTEKDFTKQNRRNLLSKIAVNDYDCIILTHDQYKQLEHTNEIKREVYEEKINELESAILFLENAKDNQGYGTDDLTKRQLKALENRKSNLRSKLNKLTQQNNVDKGSVLRI